MSEIIDSLQEHPDIVHIEQFPIIAQLFELFLQAKQEDQKLKNELRYGTVNSVKKEMRIKITKLRKKPPQSELKRHVVSQSLLEYKILEDVPDLLQELLEFHDIFDASAGINTRYSGLYTAREIQEAGCSKRDLSLQNLENLISSYEKQMEKEYMHKRRAEIKNIKNVG